MAIFQRLRQMLRASPASIGAKLTMLAALAAAVFLILALIVIQELAPPSVLLATVGVGVLVLALLWRMGNRLVVRPLSEIGGALETMQQEGGLSRIETRPPTHEW